jgi:hypothetical protein
MKRLFIANSKGDDAVKIVFDSWTAELMTEESGHRYHYLGRGDVFPGENLKAYLKLPITAS